MQKVRFEVKDQTQTQGPPRPIVSMKTETHTYCWYFIKVGGEETCFHKINRCNLYAQCDPVEGSDVAADEFDCDEEYKKKGLVPKKGTFCCQSLHHNEESVRANLTKGVVYIRAVLQDNNTECWNEVDEIERPTEWVSYYFPGIDLPEVRKSKNL